MSIPETTSAEGLERYVGGKYLFDSRAAVQGVSELMPDVAVLDVSLPEPNGLLATERIKQCCPRRKSSRSRAPPRLPDA